MDLPSKESKAALSMYENLKSAITSDDILTIKQLTSVIEKLVKVEHKILYEELINLGIDDLMVAGEKKLVAWLYSRVVGDYVEVYSEVEFKWFAAKIIEQPDKKTFKVHYLGWQSKYDAVIVIAEKQFSPCYLFTRPLKNNKRTFDQVSADTPAEAAQNTTVSDVQSSAETVETAPVLLTLSGRTVKTKAVEIKPVQKKRKPKAEMADKNDWICGVCKLLEAADGSDLLLCDGVCKRSFHAGCLKSKAAAASDADDNWFCEECRTGRHTCFICDKIGADYKVVV